MPSVELALTVKVNSNLFDTGTLENIYERYLYEIRNLCKVNMLVYELDSDKKLHFHAHITCSSKTPYKLLQISPLHVYVKRITSKAGWYKYMFKEPYKLVPNYRRSIPKTTWLSGNTLLDFIVTQKREHNSKAETGTGKHSFTPGHLCATEQEPPQVVPQP